MLQPCFSCLLFQASVGECRLQRIHHAHSFFLYSKHYSVHPRQGQRCGLSLSRLKNLLETTKKGTPTVTANVARSMVAGALHAARQLQLTQCSGCSRPLSCYRPCSCQCRLVATWHWSQRATWHRALHSLVGPHSTSWSGTA